MKKIGDIIIKIIIGIFLLISWAFLSLMTGMVILAPFEAFHIKYNFLYIYIISALLVPLYFYVMDRYEEYLLDLVVKECNEISYMDAWDRQDDEIPKKRRASERAEETINGIVMFSVLAILGVSFIKWIGLLDLMINYWYISIWIIGVVVAFKIMIKLESPEINSIIFCVTIMISYIYISVLMGLWVDKVFEFGSLYLYSGITLVNVLFGSYLLYFYLKMKKSEEKILVIVTIIFLSIMLPTIVCLVASGHIIWAFVATIVLMGGAYCLNMDI